MPGRFNIPGLPPGKQPQSREGYIIYLRQSGQITPEQERQIRNDAGKGGHSLLFGRGTRRKVYRGDTLIDIAKSFEKFGINPSKAAAAIAVDNDVPVVNGIPLIRPGDILNIGGILPGNELGGRFVGQELTGAIFGGGPRPGGDDGLANTGAPSADEQAQAGLENVELPQYDRRLDLGLAPQQQGGGTQGASPYPAGLDLGLADPVNQAQNEVLNALRSGEVAFGTPLEFVAQQHGLRDQDITQEMMQAALEIQRPGGLSNIQAQNALESDSNLGFRNFSNQFQNMISALTGGSQYADRPTFERTEGGGIQVAGGPAAPQTQQGAGTTAGVTASTTPEREQRQVEGIRSTASAYFQAFQYAEERGDLTLRPAQITPEVFTAVGQAFGYDRSNEFAAQVGYEYDRETSSYVRRDPLVNDGYNGGAWTYGYTRAYYSPARGRTLTRIRQYRLMRQRAAERQAAQQGQRVPQQPGASSSAHQAFAPGLQIWKGSFAS